MLRGRTLAKDVTQGSALRIVQPNGDIVECPLKHTDVEADVSGFIARVKVTQTFFNPTKEKIEAVYVFPLPHEAAVDDMTMRIGEKKILGVIKKRAEANHLRAGAGPRTNCGPFGTRTAEHLYAIRRKYRPRSGSKNRDLVCRCVAVRRGTLRVSFPHGGGPALQPRRADRQPHADSARIGGQGFAATTADNCACPMHSESVRRCLSRACETVTT